MPFPIVPFLRNCRPWLLVLAAIHLAGCAGHQLRADEQAQVADKTYVVTGASSGFGRGVAQKLGAMRANVVLAARRTEVLQQVEAEVRSAGGMPLVVTTDVGKPEDVQRLAAAAIERFGRIDVWINNAAVGIIGRFEDVPVEDHARMIDTNVKGVIYGSHAALRQFRKQGYGALVNIGSVESESPLAYHASYSASKGAVINLGRALNEELRLAGQDKIFVSTVMPWATDTPFFDHAANHSGHAPRMPAMDGPEKVVDAIVWASVNPREEVPVGWKASAAVASHNVFPDLTERISATIVHKYQFEKAPPMSPGSGAVHKPMAEGVGVDGGLRKRMEEDQARKP
ncbi:MAG TPA: SDR family NAD(P)-dependent oxidoreductase [Noviherbaspirillum sp.]|jgi:short-subunit dehydrogenase|uniref:SDR family NAD(P)-dependent oxidoreductase n=1 Tax=Noviherbaspirillum sp. TaxID=1926288 RepID=UPI002F955883